MTTDVDRDRHDTPVTGLPRTIRLMERLLTLEESAEYLRLTPGALYMQRYRSEKPGALGSRVGRRVLYGPSDIDRFLDERLGERELHADR